MSLVPTVLWAQRKDTLYITVDVPDVTHEKINIGENVVHFQGKSGTKEYAVDLELLHEIDASKSKFVVGKRNVEFLLHKKETGAFWERLLKTAGKHWYVKADWNKWKDEDEADEEFDTSNFNMGDLGGMMGGMGGGMGGGEDFGGGEDEDDSDTEELPGLESKDEAQEEEDEEHKEQKKEVVD